MMKSDEKKSIDREILTNSIINKYGTYTLSKSQASRVLNRSVPSLDRDRANSQGPAFIKHANNSVYYPVSSLVDFLLSTQETLESQGFYDE